MGVIQRYAAGLILVLAMTAAGYGYAQHLRATAAITRAERAEADAASARRATTILSNHIQRMQADRARLDTIRAQIGEAPANADLPVDDWFRDALDRLRGGAGTSDP